MHFIYSTLTTNKYLDTYANDDICGPESSVISAAAFRHLETSDVVIDAFYRQVNLPTERILPKLLGRHGASDSLRYVSFSNNRQHEGWTVESMPGKSFHKGAA
ncbi:hypothetical protein CDAR_227591 [Caerostris darwini]|uniref:Uncharacterized protein n=1 Tax=Caerostris darwini TaxID=1538125 RepID=A0AAV4UM75_9ARAC|nr:hypothetical protein CDAR_227591 [Caerostris darwini]